MVLPTTGPISLANIQTEFGGDNPISISEYYKDGPYAFNVANNPSIPASGAISLSNFRGTQFFPDELIIESGAATAANQIILLLQRAGITNPTLVSGFTSLTTNRRNVSTTAPGDNTYDAGVSVRISFKVSTAVDIGASYTSQNQIYRIRSSKGTPLTASVVTSPVTTSVYNSPVGFIYGSSRSDGGTMGDATVNGANGDFNQTAVFTDTDNSAVASVSYRMAFWDGDFRPSVATLVGNNSPRDFAVIRPL